jgi:Tol biopolymer transport system component
MRALMTRGLVVLLIVGCGQAAGPSASDAGVRAVNPSPSGSADVRPSGQPVSSAATDANVPVPPGRIVFDRYDTALGAEGDYLGSWTVASDGSDERPVAVPLQTAILNPVWAHDGRRLALNIWTPPVGPGRPALARPDGSGFTKLQPRGVDGDLGCADWAPDGRSLLCWVTTGRSSDADGIYTLRLRDLRLVQLVRSPYHDTKGTAGECGGGDGRAIYSPDATRIAFIRQKCGNGANPSSDESAAIEIMSAAGRDLRELVPQGGVRSHTGSQLSWSPDGRQIAYGSQDGHLFIVDVASGRAAAIPLPESVGTSFASGPSWSPDGTRLVFSLFMEADASTDLYTISPDGGDLERITSADGSEQFAQWGRAPAP